MTRRTALEELAAATSALGPLRRDVAAVFAIRRELYAGENDEIAAWLNALAALLVESADVEDAALRDLDFAPGVDVIERRWLPGESDGTDGA